MRKTRNFDFSSLNTKDTKDNMPMRYENYYDVTDYYNVTDPSTMTSLPLLL